MMISIKLLTEILEDKSFFTISTLNDYQVWEVLCRIRNKYGAPAFYNYFANVATLQPHLEGRLWKILTKVLPDPPGECAEFNWEKIPKQYRLYNGEPLVPGMTFFVKCEDSCSSNGDSVEIVDIKAWKTREDEYDVRVIAKLSFALTGPSSRGGIYSTWYSPHELGKLLECWAHSEEF